MTEELNKRIDNLIKYNYEFISRKLDDVIRLSKEIRETEYEKWNEGDFMNLGTLYRLIYKKVAYIQQLYDVRKFLEEQEKPDVSRELRSKDHIRNS